MPTTSTPATETSAKRVRWHRSTGPRTRDRVEMVLPFRMDARIVKRLDRALQKAGFASRTEFMREAMAAALKKCGEGELASEVRDPASDRAA